MTRRPRRLRALGAVACAVLLAACGSEIHPNDFPGAAGTNGVANNGTGGTGGTATTGGVAGADGATSGGAVGTSGGALSGTTGGGSGGGTSGGGTSGGGTSGGGTSGGGTSQSGGGAKSGGGASQSGGGVAAAGIKAGSCAGFKNTNGITNTTIPIANVADLSGPIPGLFKSAQAAVAAYVAYFNATSSICGRKLSLESLDSQTSESGDQQAATTACGNAFAMVGSFGAFDAGGASTVTNCGIPDVRAGTTETARTNSPVAFGAYSLRVNDIPTQPFNYFKTLGGGAYKSAAFVYLNEGAASLNANSFKSGETKLGYDFKDTIPIDITKGVVDYNGIATRLKGEGVKYVQYTGAYQYMVSLQQAFAQNSYKPIVVLDPTGYDAGYVSSGGSAVNGTYVFIAGPLFEESGKNPQLANYLSWLNRTSGGNPTFFGTYAWVAAALFTQTAIELGGKLSRQTMIAALKNVHGYTNGGMVPPQNVGGKVTPNCLSEIQLQNGHWIRKTAYPYQCGSIVDSGVS